MARRGSSWPESLCGNISSVAHHFIEYRMYSTFFKSWLPSWKLVEQFDTRLSINYGATASNL